VREGISVPRNFAVGEAMAPPLPGLIASWWSVPVACAEQERAGNTRCAYDRLRSVGPAARRAGEGAQPWQVVLPDQQPAVTFAQVVVSHGIEVCLHIVNAERRHRSNQWATRPRCYTSYAR
jgi:hypothetical protein